MSGYKRETLLYAQVVMLDICMMLGTVCTLQAINMLECS